MENEPQAGSSSEPNHSPVDVYEFNQPPGEEPISKKAKRKINNKARSNFVELEDGEITLSEQMKGVMLAKVNELIDETAAPAAHGKCHCCYEDLETAHSVRSLPGSKYIMVLILILCFREETLSVSSVRRSSSSSPAWNVTAE